MNTLKDVLIKAVSVMPARHYIMQIIKGQTMLNMTQKITAALFSITDKEEYGFFVAEECVLVEKIIEVTEMPFNGDSYAEVQSRLFAHGMNTVLKAVGVEITQRGDYFTVWGPGVRHE